MGEVEKFWIQIQGYLCIFRISVKKDTFSPALNGNDLSLLEHISAIKKMLKRSIFNVILATENSTPTEVAVTCEVQEEIPEVVIIVIVKPSKFTPLGSLRFFD